MSKEIRNPVERISWNYFAENGLLYVCNKVLHLFGVAIVMEYDDKTGEVVSIYPVRSNWRGFDEDVEKEGCYKLYNYLNFNMESLKEDLKD